MPPLLLPLIAFLLGSIPWGYLLFRVRTGGDIRQRGSGNIGATNVLRTGGKGLGGLTLLLDAAKGWAAVALTQRLAPGREGLLAAALLLAILGHLYTPWLGFRGGKGVATALGAFLALAPWALLAAAAVFLGVLGLTRFVSAASIAASCALPPAMLLIYQHGFAVPVYAAAAIAAGLVIFRHRGNIARLRAGTEPRLGETRGASHA